MVRKAFAALVAGGLIATGFTTPMANAYPWGCDNPYIVQHWYSPCNPWNYTNPSWSPTNEEGKWGPGGYNPCVTPGGCYRP